MPTDTLAPSCRTTNRSCRPVHRVFPTTPGCVPAPLLGDVLGKLLSAPGAPTQTRLSERSGVPPRTLYRILNRVDRSVEFHIADALLVALDAVALWHQAPLSRYLPPPPPRRELIQPMTLRQDRARRAAIQRQRRRCNATT